jgi:hypothetical protein
MKKIILGFVLLLFFILSSSAFAQGGSLVHEDVNPNSGLSYKVKRFKEKFTLFVTIDKSAKADIYKSILSKRLAELDYIIGEKAFFYLESSSLRYSTAAGEMSEHIVRHNLKSKREEVKGLFEDHIPQLRNIRDNFDPLSAEWRFIEDDINSLQVYASQISSLEP